MQVINQSVEFVSPVDGESILKHIELCGRVCYKSECKITDTSAERFCINLIKNGHESVLEHYSVSVRFITDRGVTHEIVRHRLASYSQESTRYCNYSSDKWGHEVTFIKPVTIDEGTEAYETWKEAMQNSENAYLHMIIDEHKTAQDARSVLPNSLKTEIVMTANMREWRHFLKLRTDPAAHPQMRALALELLAMFKKNIPVLFEDITTTARI